MRGGGKEHIGKLTFLRISILFLTSKEKKSIKIQNLRGLDEKSTREIRGKECKGEEMNFNRSKFAHSEKKNSNIYLDWNVHSRQPVDYTHPHNNETRPRANPIKYILSAIF